MPYNTRRKSLSLPSLGIHLPQSSRSHHNSPLTKDQHPAKKIKRDNSPTVPVVRNPARYDPTPPPSPTPDGTIIEDAPINDDIVSAVVDVLRRTGNRPHTVKELAAVLHSAVNIVENSANPNAIISARLNGYLKRGSNHASAPCILKKKMITTHPRRIYFYLSYYPRQAIPEYEVIPPIMGRSVVSPAPSEDEEDEMRRRMEMSPSPEVDLSEHELDDTDVTTSDTASSFGDTSVGMLSRERTSTPSSLSQKSMASPPLEGDEREFSQAANLMDRRSRSASRESEASESSSSSKRSRDEYESESRDLDEMGASELLGYQHTAFEASVTTFKVKSEVEELSKSDKAHLKPSHIPDFPVLTGLGSWSGEFERHLGSPENVELDELDNLLDF